MEKISNLEAETEKIVSKTRYRKPFKHSRPFGQSPLRGSSPNLGLVLEEIAFCNLYLNILFSFVCFTLRSLFTKVNNENCHLNFHICFVCNDEKYCQNM